MSKLKRLSALLLTVILFAPVLLTGCQADNRTGGLTVWTYYEEGYLNASEIYTKYINRFNQKNPTTMISIVDKSDLTRAEYADKLRTDTLSGRGPDIIFISGSLFNDINKVMASGNLADMTALMENDKEFNQEDYRKEIMSAGQFDGKQYVIPLFYEPEILIAEQTIIKKYGVNINAMTTYEGYLDEQNKFLDTTSGKPMFYRHDDRPHLTDAYFGDIIDYENQAVALDEALLKKALETTKKTNDRGYIPLDLYSRDNIYQNHELQEVVFEKGFDLPIHYSLIDALDTPVILPRYAQPGKINAEIWYSAAISQSCKNKKTAFEFIKLLLSKDFQEDREIWFGGFPIRNESAQIKLRQNIEEAKRHIAFENGKSYPLAPLDDGFYEKYYKILKSPMRPYFHTDVSGIFAKATQSLLKNEISTDDCISQIKEGLDIYISE